MLILLNIIIFIYFLDLLSLFICFLTAYFLKIEMKELKIWHGSNSTSFRFKVNNVPVVVGYLPFGSNVKFTDDFSELSIYKRIAVTVASTLFSFLFIIVLYSNYSEPFNNSELNTLSFLFTLIPVGYLTTVLLIKLRLKFKKQDDSFNENWISAYVIYVVFLLIILVLIDKVIPFYETFEKLIKWELNLYDINTISTTKLFVKTLSIIFLILNALTFLPFYGFKGYSFIALNYELISNRKKDVLSGYFRHMIIVYLFYILVFWILLGLFFSLD